VVRRLTDGDDLTGDWFTYRQAAELLSVSTEAVRQRAKRGHWQKTLGNDKRTRIRPPEGWNDVTRIDGRAHGLRSPDERALANQVIRALESHVDTLKTQLTAAEQRAESMQPNLPRARRGMLRISPSNGRWPTGCQLGSIR
jgi:hypothetical protein